MAKAFFFTAASRDARANFEKTIKDGFDLSEVLQFLNDEDLRDKLRQHYSNGKCYMWGAQQGPSNQNTWSRMSEGDLVLGYRDRSIVSAAKVVAKIDDPELAESVWGDYEDGPFRLMYFLTEPVLCDVPISTLEEYFGKQRQGFSPVAQ